MSPSAACRATARFCRDFGPSANAKVRDPKVRASTPKSTEGPPNTHTLAPKVRARTRTGGHRASELSGWLEHHHQVCRWNDRRSPLRLPEPGDRRIRLVPQRSG